MPLTKREKEYYVNNLGAKCPYCKSEEDLRGEFVEIAHGEANQKVHCSLCGKAWIDVYKLTGIKEIGDGKID